MTPEQLDAIQARITDCATYKFGMFNADTLAHEDAPALLAYARDLEARLGRVEARHKPVVVYELDPENGTWIYDGDERRVLTTLCGECTPEFVLGEIEDGDYDGSGSDADVQYPCPTIAALTATEGQA